MFFPGAVAFPEAKPYGVGPLRARRTSAAYVFLTYPMFPTFPLLHDEHGTRLSAYIYSCNSHGA